MNSVPCTKSGDAPTLTDELDTLDKMLAAQGAIIFRAIPRALGFSVDPGPAASYPCGEDGVDGLHTRVLCALDEVRAQSEMLGWILNVVRKLGVETAPCPAE